MSNIHELNPECCPAAYKLERKASPEPRLPAERFHAMAIDGVAW
jgi:hypothetical protein